MGDTTDRTLVWDAINAVFPLAVVLWTAALCTTLYEASAALLLAGLAAVVAVVGVLKVAVGRGRPDRSDARSFPSGHAAVAAFLAAATGAALLLRSDDTPPGWRVGPTLLSIAAAVAATAAGGARVGASRHHASDVVVGWAIGTAGGWATWRIGHIPSPTF
jgi:membrane-associated phospholipid phosphatase